MLKHILDELLFPYTLCSFEILQKWAINSTFARKVFCFKHTPLYFVVKEFVIQNGEKYRFDENSIAPLETEITNSSINVWLFKFSYTQYLLDQKHLIETLIVGERALTYGNIYDIFLFSRKWNKLVDDYKEPTNHMWNLYNKIQQRYNSPIRRFRYNREKFERLKVYQDLEINLETSSFPPGFFEEWFILKGKITGKKCLIDINVVNPETGLGETFFIRNTKSTWNKNGVPPYLFAKKTGARRKILDNLMNTINPNEPELSGIRNTLKDELISELKAKDIGYPDDSWHARSGFKKVYQMKFDEIFLEDYLEVIFWEYIQNIKPSWLPRYKNVQKIVKYFEDNGKSVISITNELYDSMIYNYTKIYLQDKSKLFATITMKMNNLKQINSEQSNFKNWGDDEALKIAPMDLARTIQKIRKKREYLHDTGIVYSIDQAEKFLNIGSITRNFNNFLDENNPRGLPAFVGAIIQDSMNRLIITQLSKELGELEYLDLTKNVISEIKWGFIKTRKNLITFPDIITKSNQKACEIIQTKIIRELGNVKGKLRDTAFLFDELKTMGDYHSIFRSVINLQIEFIPKGYPLNGYLNLAKCFNVLVISYWGKNFNEFGRLMEVISAIRHGIFKRNIKDPDVLLTHTIEILHNYGNEAIGFTRDLDNNTRRTISELIGIAKFDGGEETFFRDIYLYILKKTLKAKFVPV